MPAYPVPANQRSRNNVSNIISVGSVARADGAGNQRLIQQQACSSVLQQAQTLEPLSVESSDSVESFSTKHYTKTLAFLYLLQFLKAPKAELLCQNQKATVWEGESSLGCVCRSCNEHLNPAFRFSLLPGTPPHKPLLLRISWPIHTKKKSLITTVNSLAKRPQLHFTQKSPNLCYFC